MKLRDRRVGLLVLTVMVFVSLAAAQAPLRPLVMRSEETRGVAPPECAEGLADTPPPPRIAVSEIPLPEPEPSDVPPPPSATLRGNLEAVQNALLRNDRPAFDESLARTRTLVESYPTGGERTAAEEALRVYGDVARLWDAQYVSPFFGEDSPEYAAVSAYPGWAEAVRRATFTDAAGRRFYPAAESRQFLATIAAQRLQRLGVRTTMPPARVTRTERPPFSTDSLSPAPTTRTTPRATSTTPRRSSGSSTTSRPRTTTRSTTRESRSTATSTTRKPATATLTPSKPNPSAPPTTAADPAPATTAAPSSPAAGDVGASSDVAPTNADAPTSTTPAWTDTTPMDRPSATTVPDAGTAVDTAADTAFSTPDTATTTATTGTTSEAAPSPKRPVLLATILILIGLGVLIVLFRASR